MARARLSDVQRQARPVVTAFLARRVLLAAGVLAAVTFGTFALMATRFTSQCTSQYTPTGVANPPLAANVGQASRLYWHWLQGIPTGRSFGAVCGFSGTTQQIGSSFAHTALLLGLTGLLVVVFALGIGTLAATRAGSMLDTALRAFAYAAWAVPAFVLALVLQSVLTWAGRNGFHAFALAGWSGSCYARVGFFTPQCSASGHGVGRIVEFFRHVTVPAACLAVAFIGLHSRYLRSSLLVALNAPYTVTARAKGLPERRVVLRHALRNSLATFTSALLLDFGAIFGAAMAVDAVFHLNGLGSMLLNEIGGSGGGDGPRPIDPYAVETLLGAAALMVLFASVVAELAIAGLDPRARLR
jgi:peptide/nickel transport system permease protein